MEVQTGDGSDENDEVIHEDPWGVNVQGRLYRA
jgi:hypothetical protein